MGGDKGEGGFIKGEKKISKAIRNVSKSKNMY